MCPILTNASARGVGLISIEIIAHRATSGRFPQNSLESTRFLIESGIKALELDVTENRRGEIVVAHPGLLSDEEVDNAPKWTGFADVIGVSKTLELLDVKYPSWTQTRLPKSILEAVAGRQLLDRTIVISPRQDILDAARAFHVKAGHILSTYESKPVCTECDYILVPVDQLTPRNVRDRERLVLTKVESNEGLRKALQLGVRYVMSDRALDLMAYLDVLQS